MKKVMQFLMLSCKKAVALIDKKAEVKLKMKEKYMLIMHTAMCDVCSAYQKQSRLIDRILHAHIDSNNEVNFPVIENKELQKQIVSKL